MKTNGNDSVQWIPGIEELGLTKREYFATMAMNALISRLTGAELCIADFTMATQHTVKASDALIEALNKELL